MIPTIGRQVWFRSKDSTKAAQPEAATVCFVHNDNLVNLQVISHGGYPRSEVNVPLVQDESIPLHNTLPADYCTWMPYQKAVAAGHIQPAVHAQPPQGLTATAARQQRERDRAAGGATNNAGV